MSQEIIFMKQLMLDFWKDNNSLHESYLSPALGSLTFTGYKLVESYSGLERITKGNLLKTMVMQTF